MTNWTEYTGSDEQIAELKGAKNGFLLRIEDEESCILNFPFEIDDFAVESYWLIPDDPLRGMKVRQAMTGQPVWIKEGIDCIRPFIYETHNPDWNIPNAEYSFTEFKD